MWSLGGGIGTLGYDAADGPCTTCDHSNVALAVEMTGGVEIGAGLAAFARVDVGIGFVDGLGTEGMGRSGKLAQVALIVGGRLRIGPLLQLLGGVGYGHAQYTWKEYRDGIFGTITEEFELAIGSGPMALGGARLSLPVMSRLDLGIEGAMRVMRMSDAGTTSLLTFGIVGGWL
jgi:hypothetical protein